MKRTICMLALTALLAIPGCKRANAPLPQGAINSFDATSYQSLMTAQAALNTLKQEEPAVPQIKPFLNQAIQDYNVAEAAWQAWHAGGGNSAGVSAALTTLSADILKIEGLIPSTTTGAKQ